MEIAAFAAAVFSEPGAVAIIHNLFANVIWAIGCYGGKVAVAQIRQIRGGREHSRYLPPQAARHKLRPRVEKFLKLLAEASNGGRLKLRSGDEEIEVEFYPKDRDRGLW
jgi:hypothetical protein